MSHLHTYAVSLIPPFGLTLSFILGSPAVCIKHRPNCNHTQPSQYEVSKWVNCNCEYLRKSVTETSCELISVKRRVVMFNYFSLYFCPVTLLI